MRIVTGMRHLIVNKKRITGETIDIDKREGFRRATLRKMETPILSEPVRTENEESSN